jgi:hypothetical protein
MERGELIRPLIETRTIEETHWTHGMLGGFFSWMQFLFHSL